MKATAWTAEDIAKLSELANKGASLMRATVALRRSSGSVAKKAREIGKPLPGVREVKARLRERLETP